MIKIVVDWKFKYMRSYDVTHLQIYYTRYYSSASLGFHSVEMFSGHCRIESYCNRFLSDVKCNWSKELMKQAEKLCCVYHHTKSKAANIYSVRKEGGLQHQLHKKFS